MRSAGIAAGAASLADIPTFDAVAEQVAGQPVRSPLTIQQEIRALQSKSLSGSVRRVQSTSLDPWTPSSSEPWDVHHIHHLYRRAGFGATYGEIRNAQKMLPAAMVEALLSDSVIADNAIPAPPAHSELWLNKKPYFGSDLTLTQAQQNNYAYATLAMRRQWLTAMAQPATMLREKMTLFWMNHFVIEEQKVYFPQMIYHYLDYFRRHPWGNFKQMVKDVTISPAMLVYLDGASSGPQHPNENYARELMELFTLGVTDKNGNPHYTEDDIKEVAKALTGYTIDYTASEPNVLPATYLIALHNSTLKSPFGAPRKNYGLASSNVVQDDVIDLLFTMKGDDVAWYLCSKLYQYFVYHDISGADERAVIDQMAATLKANNWELKPVLSQLFKSQHFFDNGNIGAEIKSPMEFVVTMLRQFDIQMTDLQAGSLYYYAAALGQILLDPPNVKGWPGDRTWISTTTLPYRNVLIAGQLIANKQMAAYGSTGYGENNTAITLDDTALLAWAKQFDNYNDTLQTFVDEVLTYFCALHPSAKAVSEQILAALPPNAYEWASLSDQDRLTSIRRILLKTVNLAEYQLA